MRSAPTPIPDPHTPVLLEQVVQVLSPQPGETIVDCTVGFAGHAIALAERLAGNGTIVGIDLDPVCIEQARQRLADLAVRVELTHGNFAELDRILADLNIGQADIIFADLGVNSSQLADPHRGFSFSHDGPLDMRYDPSLKQTAADLVNSLPERELADLIFRYSQEKFSRKIARQICVARRSGRITTTAALAKIVARAVGVDPAQKTGRIHPATRTFLALRIAVNRELENLEALLEKAPRLLRPGGRIAIISFHSGEDRLVKTYFQKGRDEGLYEIITRKPITPDEDEVRQNPRARSAKLRAARRTDKPI